MPSPAAACWNAAPTSALPWLGNGRIGVTELLVGVPFPPLAFEIMRFASPPRYLADGMFSGATFTPDVALTRGLVDELADGPAALLDRAIAAAETLAALSPAAFALTKQQVRQPVADAMERHGRRVAAAAEEIWTAPETIDHIRRLRRAHVQEDLVSPLKNLEIEVLVSL